MSKTEWFGWAGRVLQVDLSREKIVIEPLSREFAVNYIGGRGFTSRMQFDCLEPGIDPLSPENVLMFSVGPFNGTLAPGSSRWHVAAKSPLTGLIGDGCACGLFGAELKWAGYDLIVIRGRAQKPSYLWIRDDDVILTDAAAMWGRSTRETERLVQEEVGDPEARVATVGPAAENQVKITIVQNQMRSCGRGGMGAVMASKNLKAVAVRGTKGVKVAHPKEFEKLIEEAQNTRDWVERGGKKVNVLTKVQGALSSLIVELGVMGTRNNQTGVFENAEKLSTDVLREYYVQRKGYLCPTPCDHLFVIEDGPFYGNSVQFASSGNFGPMLGNNDFKSILKVHLLADELGIDVLSLGPTLSFAMECYEKGILTKKDTEGLDLTWGNMDAVLELIPKIANREGFGKILAEGTRGAAKIIGKGAEEYALHVKGMEPPWIDDPRGLSGRALSYAVAARGGDHQRGAPLVDTEVDIGRFKPTGKGKLVATTEHLKSLHNSLEMCVWMRGNNQNPSFTAKMFTAITGVEIDGEGLMRIGERITNVERAFNVREGITRKDDTLPKRFLEEPMPEGLSKGYVVPLEPMLDEYYHQRGWDIKTGLPKRSKLEELGLKDVANELEQLKKLPFEEH